MSKKHIIIAVVLIVAIFAGSVLYQILTDNSSDEPIKELVADGEMELENPTYAPEQPIYELRADGYGPVKIGMSIKEASEAIKMPLTSNSPDADEPSCFYVYPYGEPGTVGFMIINNKIARVDVHFENPDIQTDKKIKFGSSTADVKKAYGKIKIEPHPYGGPEESYLIYDYNDQLQIIFETDQKGNVTSLRSGKKPEVGFIEGCS